MSAGLVAGAIIQIGIGMGLAAGSKLLAKEKRRKITLQDDKPSTTSTRGEWIPSILGRRRVGAYIGWVGDRNTEFETQGSNSVEIVRESAWHILATGPCDHLYKIYMGGAILFKGRISRTTHPSGSLIDVGAWGSFNIYWGELGQPINNFLRGNFNTSTGLWDRTGVLSRWPHVCYIQWNQFRLGNKSTWDLMEYEIERRPDPSNRLTNGTTSDISDDPSYFPGSAPPSPIWDLSADAGVDGGSVDNGTPGVLRLADTSIGLPGTDPDGGNFRNNFPRGATVFLSQANADPNGYTVAYTEYYRKLEVPWFGTVIAYPVTFVTMEETFTGISETGNVTVEQFPDTDGLNYAHMIHSLLFDGEHLGAELDPSKVSVPSLEILATLFNNVNENLHGSLVLNSGDTVQDILAALLLDSGVFMVWDPNSGLYDFRAIRDPAQGYTYIPNQNFLSRPEIVKRIREPSVNIPIFTFPDRRRNYRDMPITTTLFNVKERRPSSEKIVTTATYEVAAKIAERRAQEFMIKEGIHTLQVSKGARDLIPGDPVQSDLLASPLRILSVTHNQLHNNTKITAFSDMYGVTPTLKLVEDTEQGLASTDLLPAAPPAQPN